jgi:(S)-2-hydroxyglutarate dehydrogenase
MGSERYDVAVVGAGIVGLAVAREVLARRPEARVLVVDKQASVAQHQTGHNSGVIHAGVYYSPGSLKARLCVRGAAMMYAFCQENEVPFERCGKLIVAVRDEELGRLGDLEARGRANGVPGLRRIGAQEIGEIEPECQGVAALHSPATGIVSFAAVARAMERELRAKGVTFALGSEIAAIRRTTGGSGGAGPGTADSAASARSRGGAGAAAATVLVHANGEFRAAGAIVCAGLWSDRLAVSAGAPAEPRVVPFRGAYLRIADGQPPVVRGLVYPVPDPALPFLGVHVTRHIGGGVLLGPTALLVAARDGYHAAAARRLARAPRDVAAAISDSRRTLRDGWETVTWPGTWGVARAFWRTGMSEIAMASSRRLFIEKCADYVPAIASMTMDPRATFGVRAQAVSRDGRLVDDFTISETPGAIHVRNAPSPAATSSLALAAEIVDRFEAAAS